MWVVRVGGDDGELRAWHYIYVYSIEGRLVRRVIYESKDTQRGRQPHEVMKANRFICQLLDYCHGNMPKVSSWSRNSPLRRMMTNTFGVFVSIIQ